MSSTMLARLRPFGISFDKSLEDLIKGIRSHNKDPEALDTFLEASIQECRDELKSPDIEHKSMAILKLAYLEMYGYDMAWCSFHILEVLSSPRFQHKRIGYLAAIQIMQRQSNEDALMLMTNQLKKDLNSSNYIECGLALGCISSIVTPELAHDIVDDMVRLLSHSRAFIRKRAVLAMYKVFLKYPEALRTYFEQIVQRLDDSDASVVSATVNVICELAHANPANYVDLAPRLYGLLKDTKNNWMCIRLLKLFSSLSLAEPRLKKKLLPEIVGVMNSTDALSLVYECINAILTGNMLTEDDVEVAELIVTRLLTFFRSDDQNLKYVCLLAFVKTCRIHKELISRHAKILLSCLYDDDLTIRETALEIANYLVSDDNIVSVVARLLVQLVPYDEQEERLKDINEMVEDEEEEAPLVGSSSQKPIVVSDKYKLRVVEKICEVCSANNYENIPNFDWNLGVLHDILTLNDQSAAGIPAINKLVTDQLVDIAIRVPSIRPHVVSLCIELCVSAERTEEQLQRFKSGISDCVWAVGEYYTEYLEAAEEEEAEDNQKMTVAQIVSCLHNHTVYCRFADEEAGDAAAATVESVAKLFSKFCSALGGYWAQSDFEAALELCRQVVSFLEVFLTSRNFEVQERAASFTEVLKLAIEPLTKNSEDFADAAAISAPKFLTEGYRQLFECSVVKPISRTLQARIVPPLDLDLDSAIDLDAMEVFNGVLARIQEQQEKQRALQHEQEESLLTLSEHVSENDSLVSDGGGERRRLEREERMKNDPYYITSGSGAATVKEKEGVTVEEVEVKPKKRKPRKIRREKVLVLSEEGDDGDSLSPAVSESTRKKKLLVDASGLERVNLHEQVSLDEQRAESADSYQVEQEVKKMREQLSEPPAKKNIPEVVKVKRRKPKKKKAVIH